MLLIRALVVCLLISAVVQADEREQLDAVEKLAMEGIARRQEQLRIEADAAVALIRHHHNLKAGDGWDGQGYIVRKPAPTNAPPPKK